MKCGRISSLPFEQTLFAPKISKECASLVRGFGGEQTTKINADTSGLSCRKISLDGLWMFGLRLRDSMICISVHTVGIMETSSQQTLSGLIPVPLLCSKHVSSAYCIFWILLVGSFAQLCNILPARSIVQHLSVRRLVAVCSPGLFLSMEYLCHA